MKTRNTLAVAGILALTLSQGWSEPIAVSGSVYELAPEVAEQFETWRKQFDGVEPSEQQSVILKALESEFGPDKVRLIANPRVVVKAGSWASLDMAREITYPTEYDPATVPKTLAGKIHGGGALGDAGKPKLKTNDANVPTPPHPKKFEERDLGLMMKVRPQIDGRGKVTVEFRIEQSALAGFINYGTPITMDKPGALRKNAKPIEWLENQILLPVFLKHPENFKITSGEDAFHLINPIKTEDATTPKPEFTSFGTEFSEPGLSALLFAISADKLKPGLKWLPSTDSGTAAAETQSWPLTQQLRQSLGMKTEQPGPDASTEFTTWLGEFGIRVRDAKIDPEWNLEATATPEMIERIDTLLPVYEANPQVFITTRIIETNAPIGNLGKPVMNDAQVQSFFREINQMKGVDLLSAPSILVRPLQEGKVEAVREFIYPPDYDPPEIQPAKAGEEASFPVSPATPTEFKTRNIGAELAVKPRVMEDKSIELEISPNVSEHLGFLNFGQPIFIPHKGPLGKSHMVCITENRIEMPVFGRRSLNTKIRIPNGASILVGGLVKTKVQAYQDKIPLLGDLPIIGRLARSDGEIKLSRFVYFIVTAKVLDGPSVAKAKSPKP